VLSAGGKAVPVQVTGQISKGDVAAAVVGCATGGVVGCALAAVPLALAYMSLSGTRVNPQTGALEMLEKGVCTMAPCYKYYINVNFKYWTREQACAAWPTDFVSLNPGWSASGGTVVDGINNGDCRIEFRRPGSSNDEVGTYGIQRVAVEPASPTWYPATPQEVRDALYNNAITPELVDQLAQYGNIIWAQSAPAVTGPAVVTGPKVTTTKQEGSKATTVVSQESTPMTYQGARVTAGTTTKAETTTVTTTNPDGSTSSESSTVTTSTTTEPGTEPEAGTPTEEGAPSDTALPPVPDLYQRKYPNGMEGIWSDYKEELKGTDLVSLVGKLMPNVGDGGSCPTWPINLELAQWASYGTHDVAPPCWIWDVAKAILILSALLLARSLVFGG
jgi:hypothetical protein